MNKTTKKNTGNRDDGVIVIRRSRANGKVVWVCKSKNTRAAAKAYCKAKKAEKKRQRQWKKKLEEWRGWMAGVLNNFLDELPVTYELTPAQIAAARTIKALCKEEIECDHEFYRHISIEEKNRREDKKIWEEMRRRREEDKKNRN